MIIIRDEVVVSLPEGQALGEGPTSSTGPILVCISVAVLVWIPCVVLVCISAPELVWILCVMLVCASAPVLVSICGAVLVCIPCVVF